MSDLFQQIKSNWPMITTLDASLRPYSYLKTGGEARALLLLPDLETTQDVIDYLNKESILFDILGRGSNVLIKEGLIEKAILRLDYANRIIDLEDNLIEFPASMLLIKAMKLAHENFLTGLEFTVGIPGSIGGAVVMNAGVKQDDVKSVLYDISLVRSGEVIRLKKDDLELNYRHSNLQPTDFILSARFCLNKVSPDELKEVKRSTLRSLSLRKETQPYNQPSLGSTFVNPLPNFAGELIERCGLKGLREGGMMFSTKHGNFLVNDGSGTSDQALVLIEKAKEKVKQETGIDLVEEVRYLGF